MWMVEFRSNDFTKLQLDNFGGVRRGFGHLIRKIVGLGYLTKYIVSSPRFAVSGEKINKCHRYD